MILRWAFVPRADRNGAAQVTSHVTLIGPIGSFSIYMKGDINQRDTHFKRRFSPRILWTIAAVALLAGLSVLAWYRITHPPKPWLVRWRVDRYLKREAHTGNFKVDFPFPSKAEMAKPASSTATSVTPKGSRTGQSFEELREEYLTLKKTALVLDREIVRSENQLKEATAELVALTKQMDEALPGTTTAELQANAAVLRLRVSALQQTAARRAEVAAKNEVLTPIENDLWEFQRAFQAETAGSATAGAAALTKARNEFTAETEKSMETAGSYDAMYQTIGQELFVARRLLESGQPDHRRQGVTLALNASRQAANHALNGGLAARICEGYVLPHLDLATDTNRRSPFNEENLLAQCANIFRRNYEFDNVVRVYEMYLETVKTPARADWARSQIALAYEQSNEPKKALAVLREIRDTNMYRGPLRAVPRLEQQIKNGK